MTDDTLSALPVLDTFGPEGGALAPDEAALDPYALWGSRWGSSPTILGLAGGVVTWSLVGSGIALSAGTTNAIQSTFGVTVNSATALADFLYSGFVTELKAAFAQWSAVANIDFIQVADGGGAVGSGTMADIRISGVPVDGSGSTLAFTFYPNQGAISGDMFIDSGDASFYSSHSLFLVATHEIGHAIGLLHSATTAAIMYPYYNGGLNGLQADDISGAQAIYGGAQPAAAKIYNVPTGEITLTILDGIANLTINANNAGDTITGSSQNETINGGTGADALNGGGGADLLAGGFGDDHYYVDSDLDTVRELPGQGNDTVYSSHFYVMPANVETLMLTGTADTWAIGNSTAHTIYGNSGNNSLSAGSGVAMLCGGLGDDIYYVNKLADQVIENPGEGFDTIFSSVSNTLPANVDALGLTGTAALSAVGNDIFHFLYGNVGNNTLTAGSGIGILIGGLGDDTGIINNDADQVVEASGQGFDTIYSSVSYTLPNYVEAMHLTGGADLWAIGNDLTDYLYGNLGNNNLVAGTGVATLAGGVGDDLYYVNKATDTVVESASEGFDTVFSSVSYTLSSNVEALMLTGTGNTSATGNGGANFLYGNAGDNTLDGLGGNDALYGRAGADRFVFGSGAGNDTVGDFSHAEGDRLDVTAFHTSFAALSIAASGADTVITAGGQTITLTGISPASLVAQDFLF